MNQKSRKNTPIKILCLSLIFISSLFIWQGNKGFNLWDEGFLWYGVQRVLLGEVPILDFMAYDPGRYYWSAALLSIVGDNGIMSIRAVAAIFQMLGLFFGLLLIARSEENENKYSIIFWIVSATTLALWMFPRHKLFDISLSIFLIFALNFLIKNPIPKHYFFAGLCIGLVAVFGRNHGMYGAVASIGVIAWLNIRKKKIPDFLNGISLWTIGVLIGFLPIFLMALLIPGFAVAFLESIQFLFEQKATNLPLPVPWPWTINFLDLSVGDAARGILVGLFFIGTILFGGLSLMWVIYKQFKGDPVPSGLVASAFLALPYAHYAFSRADVGHLAQGIFPLLVGCFVILSTARAQIKWPLAVALCVTSFWVMYVFHPGWQCLSSKQCVSVEVSGSELQMDAGTASEIALLRQLAEQYAPNGQGFIATPFWPGAYALMERRSPMWEIYALFPRSNAFERKEIERIKASKPSFAFIINIPLDGREDLRFKNTHPLINKYITDTFEPISKNKNTNYDIYKLRDKE